MRKFAMTLATPVLVSIAVLSASSTAFAAPGDARSNPINGTVASRANDLAPEDRDGPRHKTDGVDGRVLLNVQDNVSGGLCARLYDTRGGDFFTSPVCWADGENGEKLLADGVREGTEFLVYAAKSRPGNDNKWGGQILY